ncbi:restriction endonuclease subunit S [Aerococcus mictus]|uniref:restriction endonuclease subunit S n=1 Tax=Aerococcus mictus TaxID=2976810 RepID=UPI002278C57F|nr:restriction endonuclease subunit S [Aerococcus mictus]MCY3067811.1 restriction endonuclease subunit S [Aerococcus mictus]
MQDKLKDVADVRDGTHDSPKYLSAGIPLVTSKNVSNGQINYDGVNYISLEDYKKINTRSKVDINDILMGMIGTIGNLALIHTEPSFAIKNVALIKDTQQIFYLFLYYYLQSPYITKQLFISLDGGTQKFISLKKIRNLFIRKTNSLEQKRVSYFFKSLDSIITLEQKKIEKLELLKEYLLQNMFADESGYPKVRFSGFTEEWIQRELGDVAEYRRGSFPQPYGDPRWYDDNGMPFVQVADVNDNFQLHKNTKRKISKKAMPNSVYAPQDTIVITLQGSIGRVAITQYPAYVDRTLLIIEKLNQNLNKLFFTFLLSNLFIEKARKAPGGTIKTITIKELSKFNLVLPKNLLEQKRIGKILETILNIITLEQTKLEKLNALKQKLLSSLFV